MGDPNGSSNGDVTSSSSSFLHSSSSFKYKTRFNEVTRLKKMSFNSLDGSSAEEKKTQLQSKRELFFKNNGGDASTGGSLPVSSPATPPPPVPTLKDMLKRGESNNHNDSSNGLDHSSVKSSVASLKSSSNNSLEKENSGHYINTHHSNSNSTIIRMPERKIPKEADGYIGFASLPNQVFRKAVKKGFEFTLMVVGESGLGKSTLINSMFLSDIYSPEYPGPSHRIKKTVNVETSRCLLVENNVKLGLTVVDTPGFGDAVNNSDCWQPVIDYIESRYEEYLNAESRVVRSARPDTRVHACLYFIAPSGHGLKPLDVEFMQRLHDKVNIVPVIAKADTLTPEECAHFKKQILTEIAQHKIQIYEFPTGLNNEEDTSKFSKNLRDRVPFAVVGSNTVIEVEGKRVRGRKYPWGIAEVENLEHCDFIALRNMLIRTHLQDLKDVTSNVHYENFRCRKLAGLGTDGKPRLLNKNPLAQMEEERREHELKMKKMEVDMEQVFEMKVKEKKQKLRDSEADLQRRHEQMKKSLEAQIQELEEKRRSLEAEISAWEASNGVSMDELRRKSLERDSLDGKEKKTKKKGLF